LIDTVEHTRLQRAIAISSAIAMSACYFAAFRGMYFQWSTDEDMAHGILVPFVALWIAWLDRHRWRELPVRPSLWGLLILAIAACLHLAGVVGAGLFASSLAFLVSLSGLIISFGGLPLLRLVSFPLLLLVFMLPKLAVVYNQLTLPLQLLASKVASVLLVVLGFGVIRDGNILELAGRRIEVAEACNGIRYVLPLGFFALVYSRLFESRWILRTVLVAAVVPLAVLANAIRVAAIAASPALESGWPHTLSGLLLYLACLGILAILRAFAKGIYDRVK
jgi:exosortase